ncbi:hypothetical protein N7492_009103 [Penicillium capsulatum]|uniref:Tetrapyrrole biosynthesis uroporphyrinogen III synthase domain-containing protein n=1 Tax=Penicillium capsulatum TaxID=69766 RepID=A0A9W9HU89_9EURO|nr:hypothetical protein N7492_009103 [Penicillium capsulatum]
MPAKTPILLLKTKSSPHDGYEDFFSHSYNLTFIPVLEHRFHQTNLTHVRTLFTTGAFTPDHPGTQYGGMIFTSQRAVEAFTQKLEAEGRMYMTPHQSLPITRRIYASINIHIYLGISCTNTLLMYPQSQVPSPPPQIPLYTVGPATARALTTLRDTYMPAATIHGADAGTGEKLAHMILEHYNGLYATRPHKPALLFLVGEQRRDIIPKTLMAADRAPTERIGVDEVVVYETGEMESFERDFEGAVRGLEGEGARSGPAWVVVFSPSGCEAMVRVLGLGPSARSRSGTGRRVFLATIGPTTRDHLRNAFGVEADVCAEKPSPEGVEEGIRRFMDAEGNVE